MCNHNTRQRKETSELEADNITSEIVASFIMMIMYGWRKLIII